MSINWRKVDENPPADGQLCLTKMKHGYISGYYDAREGEFTGYYWRDMSWYADLWAPVSDIEPPKAGES